MKRIFTLVFVVLSLWQVPAAAQQAAASSSVPVNGFDAGKWYFGVESGAQVFFGMNDSKMSFGKRISPNVDLILGVRFTNVVGLDLSLSTSQFKGVASPVVTEAHFLNGARYSSPGEVLMKQSGYMANHYLRFLVDLTNWWGGVKPQRKASATIFAGGGIAKGLGANQDAFGATMNFGFILGFRLSNRVRLNFNFHEALVESGFDGERCQDHAFHSQAGINAGITYVFSR